MSRVSVLSTARQDETESPFAELMKRPAAFNLDAYHAMQERDDALIADEVLHGNSEGAFVYAFLLQGKLVCGVSVVGARELAYKYGGIRATVTATIEKRGALHTFSTYSPLSIDVKHIPELESEDDYYKVVMRVEDVKTGNVVEVNKLEARTGRSKDGRLFERPNYSTIADSKAYRNGVLAVLPQRVIIEFKKQCLKRAVEQGALDPGTVPAAKQYLARLDASPVASTKTIDQLRDGAMAFASKLGIALDRMTMKDLTYAELMGLGQAAKDPKDFEAVANALGIVRERAEPQAPEPKQPAAPKRPKVEPQNQTSGAPFGFAVVESAILKADTLDALDAAVDGANEIADAGQRDELYAMAKTRRAELEGQE